MNEITNPKKNRKITKLYLPLNCYLESWQQFLWLNLFAKKEKHMKSREKPLIMIHRVRNQNLSLYFYQHTEKTVGMKLLTIIMSLRMLIVRTR